MKALARVLIFLAACVLLSLLGYFILTRPGVQHRIIQSKLPEGSSIDFVKLTPGALTLKEVQYVLPDQTSLKINLLSAQFSIWDALFKDTIHIRNLELSGVDIDLSNTIPSTQIGQETTESSEASTPPSVSDGLTGIYDLGQSPWLLMIDRLRIDGILQTNEGNQLKLRIQADELKPGAPGLIELLFNATITSEKQTQLSEVSGALQLELLQKETGGLERLQISTVLEVKDRQSATILEMTNKVDFSLHSEADSSDLSASWSLDLSQPERFLPEAKDIESVQLKGSMALHTQALLAELSSLNLNATINGDELAKVELKQALNLNGKQNYTGELLEIFVDRFPLHLLSFALPKPLQVSGAPLSAQFMMTGESDGGLNFVANQAVVFGPISVNDGDRILLDSITLGLKPDLHIAASGEISLDLSSIEITSKGRDILVGHLLAKVPVTDSALDPSLTQANGGFTLSLSDLFDQPVLAELGELPSGRLDLEWNYGGALSKQANLNATLSRLRLLDKPQFLPDYRFVLQLTPSDTGSYSIESDVSVGSERSPSSDIHLSANLQPESQPVQFDFALVSDQLKQSDFSQLAQVFEPAPAVEITEQTKEDSEATRPPWASVAGNGTVNIERLLLESGIEAAKVYFAVGISEETLAMTDFSTQIGGGEASGGVYMNYAAAKALPYTALADIRLNEIDPSRFKSVGASPLPIKGLFNGLVSAEGHGLSVEAAIENLSGGIELHGEQGVLTAFELDQRAMAGLSIVGILGQSLERPGVTALTETIPYFKEIRFSSFDLSLNRAEDKQIKISQLKLVSDNLFMEGRGFVAASSWGELAQQPLDLKLSLGAKGTLVRWLETLNLLKPTSNPQGFREWNQSIDIGGTLAKPDTKALMDLLKSAASSALSKPTNQSEVNPGEAKSGEPTKSAEKSKTKTEKRRDEIDIGLELLNNVFGN